MSEFPVITRYEVQGAEDVINTNARIWESLEKGEHSVKSLSQALRDNMAKTYALRRAYSGIRMVIRVQYAEYFELARGMMAVQRMGTAILSIVTAYSVAMMRVDRAQQNVIESTKDVAKWQRLYNQYLEDFGSESAYTRNALEQVTDALDELEEAEKRAADAALALKMMWVGVGLQAPLFMASLFDVGYHVLNLRALIAAKGGLIPALADLKISFMEFSGGTLLGTLGLITAAVGGVVGAIYAYKAAMGEELPLWARVTMPLATLIETLRPYATGEREGLPAGRGRYGRGGEFGIYDIPETGMIMAHKHEKLMTPFQYETSARRGTIIQASVTQYNTITKEADADAVASRAYRALLQKLGDKAW